MLLTMKEGNVKLQEFQPQHIHDMGRLQSKVYPKSYQETLKDLTIVLHRPDVIGLVIRDAAKVLGYIVGFPIDPLDLLPEIQNPKKVNVQQLHKIPKSCLAIFIYDCVIDPNCQGKGFGSLLVSHFIEACQSHEYKRIWGVAVDEKAEQFWLKNGFQPVMDAPCVHDQQLIHGCIEWWNLIEMQKKLPLIYSSTPSRLVICSL